MKIQQWIARIGEEPGFVAAMAHAWFACSFILIADRSGIPPWVSVPVFVLGALWKEFYQDVHYERNPPQTLLNGTEDFLEYMAGIAIALLVILL